jgi:hypothetical protein
MNVLPHASTKTSFKIPKKRVSLVKKSMKNFPNPREFEFGKTKISQDVL